MLSSALRSTLGRRRTELVQSKADHYSTNLPREEIESFQVGRFNDVWSDALQRVPFYRTWATEHKLPESIQILSDLRDFPPLTKSVMVDRAEEIFTDTRGDTIEQAYSTGGTTGTPTRYPRGSSEGGDRYANSYAARSWWGIRPFDSYVHVWGHAHLFDGRRLSKLERRWKDLMVNAVRVDAYDMSEAALASHVQAVLRSNPRYVIGYTSALFKLARHIESAELDVSGLTNLRAVIVTAETVTSADADLISEIFRVPVVIEYGAAETGVIAYSRGTTWPLQVLWRSFIVSVADDSNLSLTTLDNRLFPLINYSIGDMAEGGDISDGNALTLGAVIGRAQDAVTVSTEEGRNLELSAILPVHILKTMPGITAVQYRQESSGRLCVLLTAIHTLDLKSVADQFAATLRIDHPDFASSSIVFKQVPEPVLTKAGKQALFV